MDSADIRVRPQDPGVPNGSGAAAVLAAGIGSLALAVLAILSDRVTAFARAMMFYKPTGPLSGVTCSALAIWLIIWAALDFRWRRRNVRLRGVSVAAIVLLLVGFLLMFPPIADLF